VTERSHAVLNSLAAISELQVAARTSAFSFKGALRLRDPGLSLLKTDPLMDPLRREPRYRAVERQLNFPE